MAKGLRSKIKRHFRTQKRETVAQAPWQLEAERKRQELMEQVLAGSTVAGQQQGGEDGAAGPSSMAAEAGGAVAPASDAAMAVDGQPELATKNPDKILKKLKKARLAKVKGIVKGQKKRRSLQKQGAKAFLQKKKKR